MRSVVVVLPASMCAMMPILRIFSSGVVRAIKLSYLPAIVGKSLIGLGHAVDVVFLLNCSASGIGGVVQFIRQLFGHALFRARAGVAENPPNRKAGPAIIGNFHRHLIVGATDAARLHFEQRLA